MMKTLEWQSVIDPAGAPEALFRVSRALYQLVADAATPERLGRSLGRRKYR